MRIGLDMLALQSPESRGRGIGRYARSLVSAVLPLDPSVEFILYAHHSLPTDSFPHAPNARIRHLPAAPSAAEAIDRLARANPDRLDVLLLLSPFELHAEFDPPARPLDGPAMAAVLYDLVPFLFQEKYLTWLPAARRFYRNLERLRGYDALLAISESARADGRKLLGAAGDRIVTISGASNPDFFTPPASAEPSPEERATLGRFGIDRPYVFSLASTDERKNLRGLVDAFRLLPAHLRESHQLVVACSLPQNDAEEVRRLAEERGVLDALVLTGGVDDETLRLLYRRCAVFAFPSFYEGFGLPILEAMHCGAPVVAGNNSSQVEVVGDAGLLVNAHDASDIAAKLSLVLGDPRPAATPTQYPTPNPHPPFIIEGPLPDHRTGCAPRGMIPRHLVDRTALADTLRIKGIAQARRFSWRVSAERALEALRVAAGRNRPCRRLRSDRAHCRQPRLAVFSPWPPKATGIADYAIRLVRALRDYYEIDLYCDTGYEPDLGRDGHAFGYHDHRLFARNARVLDYRGVLYQMGNSYYHRFVYDALVRHRGIVTLHDFNLAGFHYWTSPREHAEPEAFLREVAHSHPNRADEVRDSLGDWLQVEGLQDAFARRGLNMNRRVFEHAEAVVVHSPWTREQIRMQRPESLGHTFLIPIGATPAPISNEERSSIRARFGLPPEALIVGSFGSLHASKMNEETLTAFARWAPDRPSAVMLFVGKDLTFGALRRRAEELGLGARVRIFGHASDADFQDLIAATDIGIALRRPPTNGETSGALIHLLRHGIPTIVSDVGTFADYPDDVVRKVQLNSEGLGGLTRALREVSARPEALRRAAVDYVARVHDWSIVAAKYAELIEKRYAERFTTEGTENTEKRRALIAS